MIICPLKSITEKQMTSNEFTLSAALLHFDRKALNAIRNGKVQVVHASAEQVLKEQFATLLTEDCPFHCSLSLIVVDRRISHCLYMVSILFEIFSFLSVCHSSFGSHWYSRFRNWKKDPSPVVTDTRCPLHHTFS